MSLKTHLKAQQVTEPLLLSGNQAIARAAIEAGVTLVTGYPGTPSTYAISTLLSLGELPFRVEWAINEKVAFENATGVSWSGKRALVTMKMSGLNVAADSFLGVQYSGAKGGLVIYVADDPNVYYGMVEQDSRHYARLGIAPMLAPATPQEALDFTRRAFALSEEIGRPVMVLGTTVLSNTSEMVTCGAVETIVREPSFEFDIATYAKAGPAKCVVQHQDTLAALDDFGQRADDVNELTLTDSRVGVVGVGVSWNYVREALETAGVAPCTLKLGMAHPIAQGKLRRMMETVDTLLVFEELEPFVEEAALVLRAEVDHPVNVIGKINGPLTRTNDYSVDTVMGLLRDQFPDLPAPPADDIAAAAAEVKVARLNTFCAGCPHRATYYALNTAIKDLGYAHEDVVITGDIGCTILGMNVPFQSCWTEISMGSSISLAEGFKQAGMPNPVVATIGDGTFFHGGIPALLQAAFNGTNITVIILNNHWASMTGMQPHLATSQHGYPEGKHNVSIENMVRAAGIENVTVVNPFRCRKIIDALTAALKSDGLSVVIADAECVIPKQRRKKIKATLRVAADKCIGLDACEPNCIQVLGCPAIERAGDGKAVIDPEVCVACGLCHQVCRYGAI